MGNSTGYRCDKKKEGENLKEEGKREFPNIKKKELPTPSTCVRACVRYEKKKEGGNSLKRKEGKI